MEPELECVDPKTGKSEGFGELKGGLVVAVSLETSRRYVTPARHRRLRCRLTVQPVRAGTPSAASAGGANSV